MKLLGTDVREISIADAVTDHFKAIGHDISVHDVTYENSQARERTQILMDIANESGGMVIGTGDLSEAALGWCTYNGDHMAMYNVNASVTKTLVKGVVAWVADHKASDRQEDADFSSDNAALRRALHDIIDTPISPELLPPDKDGKIVQKLSLIHILPAHRSSSIPVQNRKPRELQMHAADWRRISARSAAQVLSQLPAAQANPLQMPSTADNVSSRKTDPFSQKAKV